MLDSVKRQSQFMTQLKGSHFDLSVTLGLLLLSMLQISMLREDSVKRINFAIIFFKQ